MGRIMRNRQEYGGGSSGSGHIITDGNGTSMAQESKLKFVGSNVADDSTHQSTVVTNALEVTQAEYDALVQAGEVLTDVDYYIEDAAPTAIDAAHLPYSSTMSTKAKIDSLPTDASELPYSSTQSTKQKIDEVNAKIQRIEVKSSNKLTFNNIPSTCTGLLLERGFNDASAKWVLTPFNIYSGTAVVDSSLNLENEPRFIPSSASYSNGTLEFTMSTSIYCFATLIYG